MPGVDFWGDFSFLAGFGSVGIVFCSKSHIKVGRPKIDWKVKLFEIRERKMWPMTNIYNLMTML